MGITEQFYGDGYLGTIPSRSTPKKPAVYVLGLAPDPEMPCRLVVEGIYIVSRHFDVKPVGLNMRISKHAIERVFQRLKVDTPKAAMSEILSAVRQVFNNPIELGELDIKTQHGEFRGIVEPAEGDSFSMIFTTFLADDERAE